MLGFERDRVKTVILSPTRLARVAEEWVQMISKRKVSRSFCEPIVSILKGTPSLKKYV